MNLLDMAVLALGSVALVMVFIKKADIEKSKVRISVEVKAKK